MSFRKEIAPVILAAIEEGKKRGLEGRDLERFVRKNSWIWGPREMWPYRVWCDEVKIQLGIRRPKRGAPPEELPLFDEPKETTQ